MRHSLLPLLLCSLIPAAVLAQVPDANKTTPAFEETGEPEGNDHTLPPRHLDPRIWNLKEPLLLDIARRVEAGTAPLPMARSFDRLYTRLFPFTQGVPGDWREKAMRAERALRPVQRGNIASPSIINSTTLTWALIGPATYSIGSDQVSGRATAIYVDPANKNNIILGTADGGLWKTTDQGVNWASLTANLPSLSIGSIAVDPANSSIIFAGTGEGNFSADLISGMGIFKSTNGGGAWTQLPQPSWPYAQPYHNVRRIVVDPRNSQLVYAALDGGLYYSSNGGTTWALTTCGAAAGPMGTDLVVDSVTPSAGSPSIVYVAFGYFAGSAPNGIYRNSDGNLGTAASWAKISAAPATGFPAANVGRITLVQAPSDRKQIYALVQNTATYQNLGIFYTADATAATVAWIAKSTTSYCSAQCWYDMHGAVDPTTPSKLFVGGLDDYLSTDTGATLTQKSQWNSGGSVFSHADHHFLVMPDATTLYDANDGGFFIGTVSGTTVTWINRNSGLATLQFYGFAQSPTDATKIHGGLQDNGDAYYNGTTWTEVIGGDGGKAAWDQTNGAYAYEEYVYAGIRRNSNMTGTPNSWTCIQNFGGCSTCSNACRADNTAAFIAPFTLDANDQNVLYTGTNFVYRNPAARTGNTWTAISPTLGGTITAFHSAKNNGTAGTLYAGVGLGAQMTTNANTAAPPATWTNIGAGLPGGTVTGFATDPVNGQNVLVTTSGYTAGHIYRSTTGGTSWTNITGSLPAVPFNTIVLNPTDPNHAYASSDFGVYENTAVWTGSTWTSLQSNLPLVAVDELGFNPINGKLRAATHGRSAWELSIVTTVANPVPDGSFITGTPLRAGKGGGVNISVTFDTTTCTPGGYNAYWGTLSAAALSAYTYSGSQCAVASGGNITTIPAATSAFFVVAGTDGATAESRNVQDSAGVWHGSGVGLCSIATQSSTTTCP